MDQLFQIFIDEESEDKDICIKMYQSGTNDERFLCIDLDEQAIDFLVPSEYPPTRLIMNIPTCMIKASSMQITLINRSEKELTSSQQTLRNNTDRNEEMDAMPPA